jgi:hypothetical protein
MKFKETVIFSQVEDDIHAIDIEEIDQNVIVFKDASVFFTNGLRSGKTKSQILDNATDEFDISKEQVESDFNSFIDRLNEYSLLV